ncbi:hypothetical protein LUU34_00808600 [Aix galericulata]|nr:hypothetical protein LUU34_00808600 [Aix galericulata]
MLSSCSVPVCSLSLDVVPGAVARQNCSVALHTQPKLALPAKCSMISASPRGSVRGTLNFACFSGASFIHWPLSAQRGPQLLLPPGSVWQGVACPNFSAREGWWPAGLRPGEKTAHDAAPQAGSKSRLPFVCT